jgi:hypothetical protein
MIDALLGVVAGDSHQADQRAPATDDTVDDTADERRRQRNVPTISYTLRGQSALMNSWEDPHYFTAAFPTLFLKGIGGHQDQRTILVSLIAFAKWALNHHSRR